jgi:hypothetical protein
VLHDFSLIIETHKAHAGDGDSQALHAALELPADAGVFFLTQPASNYEPRRFGVREHMFEDMPHGIATYDIVEGVFEAHIPCEVAIQLRQRSRPQVLEEGDILLHDLAAIVFVLCHARVILFTNAK